MNNIVPRTCIEIQQESTDQNVHHNYTSLREFRSSPAYVLLGDPGSGKSTEFGQEYRELAEEAELVTARDFLTLDLDSHPEWRGKTLFIDGLDEVRAGQANVRTPFDEIRARLDQLGKPKFRISCREADWLGENDRASLAKVSRDSKVRTLRLNPLTDQDVEAILDDHPGIIDAREFMEEARKRGIEGMLHNPQTLGLLADSVAQDGGWPESRLEIFEKACRQMAREQNQEHKIPRHLPSPDEILDVSGYLCAIQLISGGAGWSIDTDGLSSDYIDLEACGNHPSGLLRLALSTRLFRSEGRSRFTAIHRHIAEFLGGRHLAKSINGKLPATRVLALITGGDGMVVTQLRGLSAWLAAQSGDARRHLIERDPVGIGLYGDISGFSADEKRKLIKALHQDATNLGFSPTTAMAFRSLATPDIASAIRDELMALGRDHDQQMLVASLLQVLRHGNPLPQLSETLIDVARDETRWPGVKELAVSAFGRNCIDDATKTEGLSELLADIREGWLPDSDNEILGLLLTELYPLQVTPATVWDYLAAPANPIMTGAYRIFWERKLINQASSDEAFQLLNHLTDRLPDLQLSLEDHDMGSLPLALLAHVLEVCGDLTPPATIYAWLDAVLSEDGRRILQNPSDCWNRIAVWLEQRPEVQKAVILEWAKRWDGSHSLMYRDRLRRIMCYADLPAGFGHWCLEQALQTAQCQTAQLLLEWAVSASADGIGAEGLSLEIILKRTQENPVLRDALEPLLVCNLPQEYFESRKLLQEQRRYTDRDRRERRTWLEHVRSHADDLLKNQADHGTLYQVAKAYYSDQESLTELLGHDINLIEAVYAGLRGTVWRSGLPEYHNIIQAATESRMYYIALPFLAGMDEIDRENPDQLCQFSESQMRRALAFYYFTPTERGEEPQWYIRWVKEAPTVVADVMIRSAMSAIRAGKEPTPFRHGLAYELRDAEMAQLVSLHLLRGFPVRCKSEQLSTLDDLLWAALRHADRASFRKLIDMKLSRKSMGVSQRVHWLSAGLMLSPDEYRQPLEEFVGGHDDRSRQLASFCSPKGQPYIGPDDNFSPAADGLGTPTLELLIKLIGSSFGPVGMPSGWVRGEHLAQNKVRELIQRLASSPDKDATEALAVLAADEMLHKWKDELDEAVSRQRVIRRDATYCHPSVEQVCRTLTGGLPANAGDLSALVLDCLEDVGERIRTGNTDDWHQYWNEGPNRSPSKPKHEDSCRDALLSGLRQRLPGGVDAQPEGQYANDKRSDMRITYSDVSLPVEVKKNTHRDLWSAPREQLISKYTSDPNTEGYGIYLVFWFGAALTQAPAVGPRPATPEELRRQLEATLTDEEARKISICVIDVATPE